jgi:hypothetical protein
MLFGHHAEGERAVTDFVTVNQIRKKNVKYNICSGQQQQQQQQPISRQSDRLKAVDCCRESRKGEGKKEIKKEREREVVEEGSKVVSADSNVIMAR